MKTIDKEILIRRLAEYLYHGGPIQMVDKLIRDVRAIGLLKRNW